MIEVKVRLAEGKTLAAIKEETGLGRRERQVLDVYMESQGRLGHRDIAEKLDLHISNVGSIVVELKRKIIGGRAT